MGIWPGGIQPRVKKRVVRHPDQRELVNCKGLGACGVLATR